MSEDRTQPPSKRRRQLAREQGQAAHSPELTAAAGWLVALLVLGFSGGDLVRELVGMTRDAMGSTPVVGIELQTLVDQLRSQVFRLIFPLGTIVVGFAAGALVAHQLQVRGLWAVGLIAPDPARLWAPGRGGGLGAGVERIAWSVTKAVILASVSLWAIRVQWVELQRLSTLDFPRLAGAAGQSLLWPATILAAVLMIVGLADFGLRFIRFEALLRTTSEEQREDQKIMEGDLSLRSRRRRFARAWRLEAPEVLAGASLMVIGSGGLTLVLAGGPPPRRVIVRTAVQGNTGLQLRQSNRSFRLRQLDAPDIARRLALQTSSTSPIPGPQPLSPELMAELARVWPSG
jgi:flagellar biosynthetic protein FlhB